MRQNYIVIATKKTSFLFRKGLGVELVAIGVGAGVDNDQLLLLAGGHAARAFSVASFDQLDDILIEKLVDHICD